MVDRLGLVGWGRIVWLADVFCSTAAHPVSISGSNSLDILHAKPVPAYLGKLDFLA